MSLKDNMEEKVFWMNESYEIDPLPKRDVKLYRGWLWLLLLLSRSKRIAVVRRIGPKKYRNKWIQNIENKTEFKYFTNMPKQYEISE